MLNGKKPKNWQEYATVYAFSLVRDFIDNIEGNKEKYITNGLYDPRKNCFYGFSLHETTDPYTNPNIDYNKKYFYLEFYPTDERFVIGCKTEKIYGDTHFDNAPITTFLPEPGQENLTDEDKEVIKERIFNAIKQMQCFNDALKKSIDTIEKKYMVTMDFSE